MQHWSHSWLVQHAGSQPALSGYYNQNYVAVHNGITYVLRVPMAAAANMDLRLIPEQQVLTWLAEYGFPAPRLLYCAADAAHSVQSYLAGHLINTLYPDRSALPDWLAPALAELVVRLHRLPPEPFVHANRELAHSPDAAGFFLALLAFSERLYQSLLQTHAALYQRLGIPHLAFEGLDEQAGQLQDQPFVLCHNDIHRKNLILGQQLYLLDWECALYCDPAYELAVHFHRTGYTTEQEQAFLQRYLALRDQSARQARWERQIAVYRRLERIKSALGDSVRYAGELQRPELSPARRLQFGERYRRKLLMARREWGLPELSFSAAEIASLLQG